MKPTVYDCGPLGTLTVREVAERAGIDACTARARLRAKLSPERLLAPAWGRPHRRDSNEARLAARFRFAITFADRCPSIREIRSEFPELSKMTAYRWHRALQAAKAVRYAA